MTTALNQLSSDNWSHYYLNIVCIFLVHIIFKAQSHIVLYVHNNTLQCAVCKEYCALYSGWVYCSIPQYSQYLGHSPRIHYIDDHTGLINCTQGG